METSSAEWNQQRFDLFGALTHNARTDPDRLAIVTPNRPVTWAELLFLTEKVAAKLRFTGVRPGELVMVRVGSLDGWVLQLALFHEAAVAVAGNGGGVNAQLKVDWLISSTPDPAISPDRTILVNQEWFDDAKSRFKAQEQKFFESDESLVRVGFTSGTTGIPKAVPFTGRVLANRSTNTDYTKNLPEPFLCLLGPNSASGYMAQVRSVVWARTLYLVNVTDDKVWDFISDNKIARISASPIQMRGILPKLDKSKHNIEPLVFVLTAGSVLPTNLATEMRQTLGVQIRNVYGSTEAGGVAGIEVTPESDPQVAGEIIPGAQIRIVNELGEDAPQGEIGTIWVKTPSVVNGYLNDPQATDSQFQDGWFSPGDQGLLDQQGRLVLTGRSSEIINSGGVKVSPERIDEYLQSYPGVVDAATFSVTDRFGLAWTVGGVVPASSSFDMRALSLAVRRDLGKKGPKIVIPIKKVTRNENGKIQRHKLTEEHGAVLAKLIQKDIR